MIWFKTKDYYWGVIWKGYLLDKKELFDGAFKFGFYGHISTAPLLSIISILLLLVLRDSKLRLHRFLGRVYVTLTLLISAPSGFILSFFAFGGYLSKLSFLVLSVLWFYFTLKGFFYIKKGDIINHKKMMTRSFVLVISAINLRLLSFVFSNYLHWNGADMYTTASIISWSFPLFIYELKIKKAHNKV